MLLGEFRVTLIHVFYIPLIIFVSYHPIKSLISGLPQILGSHTNLFNRRKRIKDYYDRLGHLSFYATRSCCY